MIEFSLGLLLFYFGYKILKSKKNNKPTLREMQNNAFQAQTDALKVQAEVLGMKEQYETGRELDQKIAQDAMLREARAKAALIAVLQQYQCSEAQIQGVLDKIDSPES